LNKPHLMKIGKQGVEGVVAGLVLAGGKSRRMGRDKAALLVDGQTLLARQVALLGALGVAEAWVSLGADAQAAEPAVKGPELRVVRDTAPDAGPLEGIRQVLELTASEWLLVVAVDLPALDGSFLRRLLERCRMGIGVVPVSRGGREPLCAVYPVVPARTARGAWRGRGESSPRRLVSDGLAGGWMEEWTLDPADAAFLINWNVPTDWTVPR